MLILRASFSCLAPSSFSVGGFAAFTVQAGTHTAPLVSLNAGSGMVVRWYSVPLSSSLPPGDQMGMRWRGCEDA
eukprot:9167705-Alexandrium_andersonii.AAC.1